MLTPFSYFKIWIVSGWQVYYLCWTAFYKKTVQRSQIAAAQRLFEITVSAKYAFGVERSVQKINWNVGADSTGLLIPQICQCDSLQHFETNNLWKWQRNVGDDENCSSFLVFEEKQIIDFISLGCIGLIMITYGSSDPQN